MNRAILTTILALCLMARAGSPEAASLKPQTAGDGADAVTIPKMLSYQGKLTDTLGVPVANGEYPMMFLLYTVPSGGSPFWSETQSVTTRDGLFSVLLGSATPIESVPSAGTIYLGMTVSGGPQLVPRLRIASSAFAYLSGRAANSDLLQGKDTAAFATTGHNHDAAYVNEAQASSVTSNMLVDGTIAAVDLGQMGAASGQVMKWNGSAWAPRNDSVGGGGGGGTVRKVVQAAGVVCSPNPIADSGTVRFDSTWGDGRFVNEGQVSSVTSGMVQDGQIRAADIAKPCSLRASLASPGAVLHIRNDGTGSAVYVDSVGASGLHVRKSGSDGVRIDSANSSGVRVYRPGQDGFHADRASDDGIEVDSCNYGVFAHNASYTGVIGGGKWGGSFFTDVEAYGVGLIADAYNSSASDTAIVAHGKGLATGGWYTGFSEGEAACVVSDKRAILASGNARTAKGEAAATFPALFRAHLKPGAPVRISLTPRGEPAGLLYVVASDAAGFSVRLKTVPGWEGMDDVEFDWVAFGTLEAPQTSPLDYGPPEATKRRVSSPGVSDTREQEE